MATGVTRVSERIFCDGVGSAGVFKSRYGKSREALLVMCVFGVGLGKERTKQPRRTRGSFSCVYCSVQRLSQIVGTLLLEKKSEVDSANASGTQALTPGLFLNMGSGGSKIQSGTQIFWQIYFVPKTSLFAFLRFTRTVVGSISKIGQFFDHLIFLKI